MLLTAVSVFHALPIVFLVSDEDTVNIIFK